jgi:lipopolysaccharide biosynthesis glycosyltransferase
MDNFQKVAELMMLATLINEKTEYCTMVDFSGHVNSVRFRVRKSKENYKEQIFNSDFYVDRLTEERYQQIKDKFIEILKTKEIDLSDLDKREVVSYEYYL